MPKDENSIEGASSGTAAPAAGAAEAAPPAGGEPWRLQLQLWLWLWLRLRLRAPAHLERLLEGARRLVEPDADKTSVLE